MNYDDVSAHWKGEYIFASFVVAWIGSFTSLSIMKQRTGASGWRNWAALLGGSCVMGAVGIFAMHFTGMMALDLYDFNGIHLDMAFEPGYTVLSLFVVVIILMVGFVLAGTDPASVRWWKTGVVGVIGAGGVSVMHYVGMHAMICQATIDWNIGVIAASVIVGIVACTAALAIFFHFPHVWKDSLIWQSATATLLAVAVCGVHYTGMQAAHWTNSHNPPDLSNETPPGRLFIVVMVLSMVTCAAMLIYIFLRFQRLARIESAKAQCVLLNVLIRDHRGRVLTTAAGTLPSTIIEQRYLGRGAFDEENGDFLRMLKASFRWQHTRQYMSKLRDLHANGSVSAYSLQLFQQFIAAAEELSRSLGLSTEDLGYAYCEPLNLMVTLVFEEQASNSARSRTLESRGYRFEEPQHVAQQLHFMHQLHNQKNNRAASAVNNNEAQAGKDRNVAMFSGRPLNDAFAWRDWLDALSRYRKQVDQPLTPDTRDASLMELLRAVADELQLEKNTIQKELISWRSLLGRYCTTGLHLRLLASSRDQWKKVELDPMVKAMVEHVIRVDVENEAQAARKLADSREREESRTRLRERAKARESTDNLILESPGTRASNPTIASPTISSLPMVSMPSPAPSPTNANSGSNLYVALMYVAVSGSRLKVMLPAKGSWNMLPMAKLNNPHTNLGVNHLARFKQWTESATLSQPALVENLPQELHGFHTDLSQALDSLSSQVGSNTHTVMSNLWAENIITLSPQVRVMLIVTCELTNRLPQCYMHREKQLYLMPLSIFEILHYGQHEHRQSGAWVRRALKSQLGKNNQYLNNPGAGGTTGTGGQPPTAGDQKESTKGSGSSDPFDLGPEDSELYSAALSAATHHRQQMRKYSEPLASTTSSGGAFYTVNGTPIKRPSVLPGSLNSDPMSMLPPTAVPAARNSLRRPTLNINPRINRADSHGSTGLTVTNMTTTSSDIADTVTPTASVDRRTPTFPISTLSQANRSMEANRSQEGGIIVHIPQMNVPPTNSPKPSPQLTVQVVEDHHVIAIDPVAVPSVPLDKIDETPRTS